MKDYANKEKILGKQAFPKPRLVTVSFILLTLAFILAFGIVFVEGIGRQEKVTCYALQAQASEMYSFYITQDEKDMCDSNGITVNAPLYVDEECVNGVSIDVPRCPYPEEYFTNVAY